jgi:hypothetical protein
LDVEHRRLLVRYLTGVEVRGKTECWPWKRSLTKAGYGQINVDGRPQTAHRVGYTLLVGPIPEKELIRHTCDNPPCQNPIHWLTGTDMDNHRDSVERGRAVFPTPMKGSRHPESKVTEEQVLEIREKREQGVFLRVLAEEYGLSVAGVSKICRREAWTHI